MAVVFNGTDRLIEITDVLDFSFDVEKDIYSRWKDWMQISTVNSGYARAFLEGTVFGGNTTIPGQAAPKYFILTNYWRVNINNGNVNTIGLNLYSTDFDTPYLITSGGVIDLNSDSPIIDSGGSSVWTINEKDEVIQYSKKGSDNAEQANLKL